MHDIVTNLHWSFSFVANFGSFFIKMNKRTNDEWLVSLRMGGEPQAIALEELRLSLLNSLPFALSGKIAIGSSEYLALAEEVTQEALIRILDNLDAFEGRSAFTTWAQKIVVREAFTQLRRRRWQDIPLSGKDIPGDGNDPTIEMMDTQQIDPGVQAERNDLLSKFSNILTEELTEKQRNTLLLVTIQGIPLDILAEKLATTRNSLYKMMHDARLRLKNRMMEEGLDPEDLLSSFAQTNRTDQDIQMLPMYKGQR